MIFRPPAIYPLTSPEITGVSHLEQVRGLAAGGARFIQLREKSAAPAEFLQSVIETMEFARQNDLKIIINDRADIALAARADGVHLGQTDLPPAAARQILGEKAIIGFSTHSVEQAIQAARLPVDYIAIGPIFETATKADPDPVVGLEGLQKVRQAIGGFPLVAIGGITFENVEDVFRRGADSAAIVSGLLLPAETLGANFAGFDEKIKRLALPR